MTLEKKTEIATRACGAGGGRLQTNEFAAAVQDKAPPCDNGPAADP